MWDYVLLTANGHLLYFSVYISFVRLLCLPFVIVAKAWSDESAFLSPQNHTAAEVLLHSLCTIALCVL
jgi:hypothetical protein